MLRKSMIILFLFILINSFFISGIFAHPETADTKVVKDLEYSIREIYEGEQLIFREIAPKKETTNFFKKITANVIFKRGATTTADKREITDSKKFSRGNLKPSETENLESGKTYSVKNSACKKDENGREICTKVSENKFTTPTLAENVKKIEDLNQKINSNFGSREITGKKRELTYLLTERKKEMIKLAKENPNEFLRLAMSNDLINKIPARSQELVEKPVELSGKINFMHSEEIKPDGEIFSIKKSIFYSESNKQFDIYFSEKQLPIIGELNAQITGYQLDNLLVASNFKKLSDGSFKRSMKSDESSKRLYTPPVDLPDPDDFIAIEKPEMTYKLAIIPVEFLDSGARPFTKEQAYESIFINGHFPLAFKEQSYGRFAFTGKVFDWIELPINGGDSFEGSYGDSMRCNNFGLLDYILKNLPQATKDELKEYDRIYFLTNCPNYPWMGGYATNFQWIENSGTPDEYFFQIRGGLTMFNSNNYAVLPWTNNEWMYPSKHMEHELIHGMPNNLIKFIYHANGYDCDDQTFSLDCEHIEYGDKFDIMGDLGSYAEHTNAVFKEEMGWIKSSEILAITESGTYTINPLEGTISVNGKKPAKSIKAAKIQVAENFYPIYLEYRRARGIDSALNNFDLTSNQNGLFILLAFNSDWSISSSLLDADSYAGFDWSEDLQTATLNSETFYSYNQNIFSNEILGITIGPILSVTPKNITFNVSLAPLPSFCSQTWTRVNTPIFYKISFVDSNNGWAIGDNDIYHTINGGQTWTPQLINGYYSDIQFIDQQNGWAVKNLYLLRTINGGQTWTEINVPWLNKIFFVDSNNGWATGADDFGVHIYHTIDGGQTWQIQENLNFFPNDIQFINQNEGWAIGDNNNIYHTINGGQDWTIITNPNYLYQISFVDSNNGWIAGMNATYSPTIFHTTDGGQTWAPQLSNIRDYQYSDIQFIDQQNGWAVGLNNLFYTNDGGQSWLKQGGIMNFDYYLQEVFASDKDHVWIKADKKLYCLDTSPILTSPSPLAVS